MIVNPKLLNELFRAFHIQRWNDRVRPMEFIEMDKHAHKMIIAYCLGKYEEEAGRAVDWNEIIQGGIYELFRRIVISDVKSTIFHEIKKNKDVFEQLNQYIFKELSRKITDENLLNELKIFLLEQASGKNNINTLILEAAHIYSSYWEFQIIKNANPNSYQNIKIESELLNNINSFSRLEGIRKLTARHTITNFIDLCGQLRFQIRWAQTPRVPKTSVLGHSMFVACISYFFTKDIPNCPKRLYNNFFGGLFHDLPEAATRDIISPVKNSSPELDSLIKQIEKLTADTEIFPLVEKNWVKELKYFTQDEFANKIVNQDSIQKENLTVDDISKNYNSDKFNPYDGTLIRTADHISAFLEAWHSCNAGIKSEDLITSAKSISDKLKDFSIMGLNLNALFEEYKENWIP